MTEHTTRKHGGEQSGERPSATGTSPTRRTFLKATAAGALAAGFGANTIGTASAQEIPTPWLHRDGNLIRDESDNQVVLRGLNIADPKRINVTAPARGKTAEQVIDFATSDGWHPRVIRVPVQPVDIGEHTPGHIAGPPEPPAFTAGQLQAYLEDHLDSVVAKCAEVGVYCIVDFHRHWTGLSWGEGTGESITPNTALQEEVNTFWEIVAPRYADQSHVIYEMYNEPTEPGIHDDPNERDYEANIWRQWKAAAQPWVDTIRAAADNLTIIGSPTWSQTPEGATVEEFDGDDLGYTYHIYAGHPVSQDEQWDTNNDNGQGVSQVYEDVPLFVTEFGWQTDAPWPLIGESSVFGEAFIEWLDSAPIHWTAWCFDPVWLPAMVDFGDWADGADFEDSVGEPYSDEIPVLCESLPCEWVPRDGEDSGEFIRRVLEERADQDIPGGGTQPPTCEGIEVGEYCATDPNGDGKHTDVNGNGGNDFDDVVTFFEEMQSDGVQSNVSAFDFNDNGTIDFDDVVALFETV